MVVNGRPERKSGKMVCIIKQQTKKIQIVVQVFIFFLFSSISMHQVFIKEQIYKLYFVRNRVRKKLRKKFLLAISLEPSYLIIFEENQF